MINKISEALEGIGLSKEQITIYFHLLQSGEAPVKTISSKTGVGRAFTYKILEQLISLGLAEKREEPGKVTVFSPRHPERLKELAGSKEAHIVEAKKLFEENYGELSSLYNMLSGKPHVQFFEGLDGLRNVYDDILKIGKEIQIISSPLGKESEEALAIIRAQIEKQAARKIPTKAISPRSGPITEERAAEDAANLITRKVVLAEKLNIPAQIITYGDNVAITNFKDSVITVSVESAYIAETFRKIFDYIWEQT